MNYITLSQVFAGAAVGQPGETVKLAGPSLTVQTTPGCTATIYGTNMPADSASWQTIGTATGYAGTTLASAFGYVRVATNVAGTVAISATAAASSGGGGGTSNTTEATQLLVKGAAQSIDGKTPTLGRKAAAGSVPVALPSDVATDLVADSAGNLFSPGSEAVTYNYDNGTGLLANAVVTAGGVTRVKTYTWTSGNLTNESKWVVQ